MSTFKTLEVGIKDAADFKEFIKNKKVTIVGLGLFGGGLGVTKFLAEAGAKITLTDLRKENELQEPLRKLNGFKNIEYHLGYHNKSDFIDKDLIVSNPAVPLYSPYLKIAKNNGIPIETEISLFLKLCPAKTIGITGTNGKSTTSKLIYELLKSSQVSKLANIWLGGNLGISLLDKVGEIKKEDIVVLEISCFQLEYLALSKISPNISIILNIYQDHFDRYKKHEDYIRAKKHIIEFQKETDLAILNYDDEVLKNWFKETKASVYYYTRFSKMDSSVVTNNIKGYSYYLNNREICIECKSEDKQQMLVTKLFQLPEKVHPSLHPATLLSSAIISHIFCIDSASFKKTIQDYKGLEHRLEFVEEINGIKFYNDSNATNPKSVMYALERIQEPKILILGGYEKNLDYQELADAIRNNEGIKHIILIGQIREKLYRLFSGTINIYQTISFQDAVYLAYKLGAAGDAVILAPGTSSFDMFSNFRERGNEFKKAVRNLSTKYSQDLYSN